MVQEGKIEERINGVRKRKKGDGVKEKLQEINTGNVDPRYDVRKFGSVALIALILIITSCGSLPNPHDFYPTAQSRSKGLHFRYDGDMINIEGNFTPRPKKPSPKLPIERHRESADIFNNDTVRPLLNGRHYRAWEGNSYDGDWVGGLFHGQGSYRGLSGFTYSGEFIDGVPDGKGTTTWPNGDRYVGGLHHNMRDGQGIYTFAEGGVYEGQYKNNKFHGQGKYVDAQGNYYEGQWVDDKPNGDGKLLAKEGDRGAEYSGFFEGGKFHGEGFLHQYDNGHYVGSFDQNDPVGDSIFITEKNAVSYSGPWVHGVPQGIGVGVSSKKIVAIGNWTNGKLDGWIDLIFSEMLTGKAEYQAGTLIGSVNLISTIGKPKRVSINIEGKTYRLSKASVGSLQELNSEMQALDVFDAVVAIEALRVLFSTINPDITDVVEIAGNPFSDLIEISSLFSKYARNRIRMFCQFEALRHQNNPHDRKFWLALAEAFRNK